MENAPVEVQVVDSAGKIFRNFQFAFDECLVDDYLRRDIRQFTSLSRFHLLSHRLEVALHAVEADRDAIDERYRLRVFREHRRKDCCNAKGNFHFERTVRYRRSNDEDQKALE